MPDLSPDPLPALVIADHRSLYALLEHLAALRDHDEDQAAGLLVELADALEQHGSAELQVVYPLLGSDALAAGAEQHRVIGRQLARVARSRATGEDWQEDLRALQRELLLHMQREEAELAELRLEDDEWRALGEAFAAVKARLAAAPA